MRLHSFRQLLVCLRFLSVFLAKDLAASIPYGHITELNCYFEVLSPSPSVIWLKMDSIFTFILLVVFLSNLSSIFSMTFYFIFITDKINYDSQFAMYFILILALAVVELPIWDSICTSNSGVYS